MSAPVLLTGAGGQVGQIILDGLAGEYDWRLLDKEPLSPADIPDSIDRDDVYVGDISDREVVRDALADISTVVHLAADPRPDASWDSVLENNIHGMKVLLDEAVDAGVEKFVFASSNHAVKHHESGRRPDIYREDSDFNLDGDEYPNPGNFYGVSKATGEVLGRYYHEEHGLSFVAVRIGNVTGERPPVGYDRGMAMWLSPDDGVHLFDRCIQAEYGFEVVYGISDNDRKYHSLQPGREAIGYHPQDNSEEYS